MVVPLLTCCRFFKRRNTLSTLWEPKVDIYLSFLLIFFLNFGLIDCGVLFFVFNCNF